jgi:hypothetical protein
MDLLTLHHNACKGMERRETAEELRSARIKETRGCNLKVKIHFHDTNIREQKELWGKDTNREKVI